MIALFAKIVLAVLAMVLVPAIAFVFAEYFSRPKGPRP